MPEDSIEIEVIESPAIGVEVDDATPFDVEVNESTPIEVVIESPNEPDVVVEVSNPPEISVEVPADQVVDVSVDTPPAILVEVIEQGEAAGVPAWVTLSQRWSVPPVFLQAITGGEVYQYTYGATSFFRFIPDPYDSTLDAFYSAFESGVLTTLIARRANAV